MSVTNPQIPSIRELLVQLAEARDRLAVSDDGMSTGDLSHLLRSTEEKLRQVQHELRKDKQTPSDEAPAPQGVTTTSTDSRGQGEEALDAPAKEIADSQLVLNLLTALVETLPVGIIIADAHGRVLMANRTGQEILGEPISGTVYELQRPYTPYTLDGRPIAPDQMPLARALFHGESLRDVEMRLHFSDDHEVILSAAAEPLTSRTGTIIGGVTVFEDITDQRTQEDANRRLVVQLRRERHRRQRLGETLERERDILEAIMENTFTHLAYLDPEFNFIQVNAAYANGAGMGKGALIGKNHFDLFPDAENQAIFEQVRDTGEPVTYHAKPFVFPKRPELGVTYWDWSLVPIKDSAGKVTGMVLSLLDVTERHRAETEVASLARFPSENPNPVLRVRNDGTLVYANQGSKPLLQSWNVEMGEKLPLRWQSHIRETIRTQHNSSAEARVGDRIISLTVAPSPEGYANLYGLDITALRRAQNSLRQYTNRLRALHHIDQAILAAQSTKAIAEAALARLPQMIDCVRASVMLFDFETHRASLLAVYTVSGETEIGEGWQTTLDESWTAELEHLRRGQQMITEDVLTLTQPSEITTVLQAEGARALIQQPLRVQDELLGVLRLGLHTPGRPAASMLDLARELGDQLAIAIQQARLHRRIQEHAVELEQRVIWRTAALRISEARFRAIFEDAPMGIALLDREGRIVQNNAALESILGRDAIALRNRRLSAFMVDEDQATVTDLYAALMSGTSKKCRTEVRFTRSDEQAIWCNVTVSLVRDVEYQPQLAIGMVEDITERREAQAAMVQTEKLALTGQLAASLAHEINNPLQTVIGCLGLAEESLGHEERSVGTYLEMASEELKRAASIVGRLRDLNRPSNPEEKEATHLGELVEHVVAVTNKQCRDRGIAVDVVQQDEVIPVVNAVPNRLQQVFLNLILNAIDAMPSGGQLTITLGGTGDPKGVRMVFKDTGVGIPPEVQSRLFDPFHTTRPDGLGLGLFISQSIVQDHGGGISVESSPGEGTTFTIWLPAAPQD